MSKSHCFVLGVFLLGKSRTILLLVVHLHQPGSSSVWHHAGLCIGPLLQQQLPEHPLSMQAPPASQNTLAHNKLFLSERLL